MSEPGRTYLRPPSVRADLKAFATTEPEMIIVLKSSATDTEVEDVCHRITSMGYSPHTIRGALRTVIGAVGDDRDKDALRSLESLECVESVTPILKPFKLASREVRDEPTQVRVGDVTIGGRSLVVMAG